MNNCVRSTPLGSTTTPATAFVPLDAVTLMVTFVLCVLLEVFVVCVLVDVVCVVAVCPSAVATSRSAAVQTARIGTANWMRLASMIDFSQQGSLWCPVRPHPAIERSTQEGEVGACF